MEVTDSVWSIVRDLHRIAQLQRRAAARSELGPVATALLNLAAQAPVRPKAAAEALDVPAQSVTRAVTELVAAGLVRRTEDGADGRSYLVELTDQGHEACARFREELRIAFGRHLEGWSPQEVTGFAERLARLTASLAAEIMPEPTRPAVRNSWRAP